MYVANVDPRDSQTHGDCNTCCCAPAAVRPGETNKWRLNYAAWAAPIGGKGLICKTAFNLEKMSSCPVGGENSQPFNSDYFFSIEAGVTLNESVSTNASDNENDILTFAVLPLYGPKYGKVMIDAASGDVIYTPFAGFTGYDEFYFKTTDGKSAPVVNKAIVGVYEAGGTPLPAPSDDDLISIPYDAISVNNRHHFIEFPVRADPRLVVGDFYRLTVKQAAMDCDCICYWHESCYDVEVKKC